MIPDWIVKFFSVKLAALMVALWFIKEAESWQTQIIMGTVASIFIIGKNIQNSVESYCTKTREQEAK